MISPYDEALSFIKQNPGTGGAGSLAKLVLSLYNSDCSFSFAECVSGLDSRLNAVAVRMVQDYADRGETDDLLAAGKIIADDLYPDFWELGMAMRDAREATRRRWREEDENRESEEIVSAEQDFISDAHLRSIPADAADEMILADTGREGQVSAYYFSGSWRRKTLKLDEVRAAVRERGTGFIYCRAESGYYLGIVLDDKVYYVYPDYDARERYMESKAAG